MKEIAGKNIGNLTVEVYDANSVVKAKNMSVKITGHYKPLGHFKNSASFSAKTGLLGVIKFTNIPLDMYKIEISREWYEPTIVKDVPVKIPGQDPVGHFVKPNNLAKVKYPKTAPWMLTAINSLGQKEISGIKANPKILEYFKASRFWGKDDSGPENAWCASFTSWVMEQHGYTAPKNAYRAKSWSNFGKFIDKPSYGAIGIKSRNGGGHVAFVVGQSRDGKFLYMLGGNQNDEVNIHPYNQNVWEKFVVPTDYDAKNDILPIYKKDLDVAGINAIVREE